MKKYLSVVLMCFISLNVFAAGDHISGNWQGKTHVVTDVGQGEGFKTLKIHAVGHQLYRGMDTWHRLAFKCNKVAKYCDLAVELKLAGHNGVIGTQMKNGSVRLIKLGQPLENIILTPSHDGKTLDYVLIANNKTLVGHAVLHRVTVK